MGPPRVLRFFAPARACSRRTRKGTRHVSQQSLAIAARTHRRTVLVQLRGEFDLTSAPRLTALIDDLRPQADGVRHIILDLRGVTFMDLAGLREILKQNDFARTNHHNLALVRGPNAVELVLRLTNAEELLVLVDDPDDLTPPMPLEPLRIAERERADT
jgi:anti-sigma B factor antagonist